MIVLDVETYQDYFLVLLKHTETGKVYGFEMAEDVPFEGSKLYATLKKFTTVGFNSNSYDLPLIAAAIAEWTNEGLKALSDRIVKENKPGWMICRDEGIIIPPTWDHIDLINVAPGTASLKVYGGRLGSAKIQDLPIDPDTSVSPEDRESLRRYCENDLDLTIDLLRSLDKPLALREELTEQYGMDLRSKSDAQIAEAVIRSEVESASGRYPKPPNIPDDRTFRYKDPGILEFEHPQLNEVFEAILDQEFALGSNGSVRLPDWLKKTEIEIGSGVYRMGIGGLHSSEKRQYVEARDGFLFDLDVASFYPSIILQQQLSPEGMGDAFLKVYQSLVTRRLEAKGRGDKTTAETLKIAVNGAYGKLGSKYSAMYSPGLLIQTTITGQLALLMLIERVEAAGGTVFSANTDGVVVWCPRSAERSVLAAAWDWELTTSYSLERTDYRAIASRDVNNYLAVKPDGSTKGKGLFASPGLMKNPDRNIVTKAVAQHIVDGTDIEETIRGCQDIRQFVTVRTVKGGAVWEGEWLGKAVRFYASRWLTPDTCIRYASNDNKARPACHPARRYDNLRRAQSPRPKADRQASQGPRATASHGL